VLFSVGSEDNTGAGYSPDLSAPRGPGVSKNLAPV